MKRQKKMENIVLTLSFALITCLFLLQCYGIFALKLSYIEIKSKLSYVASEAVLSRNNTIARYQRMKSR